MLRDAILDSHARIVKFGYQRKGRCPAGSLASGVLLLRGHFMHGSGGAFVSNVIFGLNPLWVSTVALIVVYAVIISEKVNRAVIALVGAGLMIVVGVLDQEEAIKGVDFNTIALLTGMMILVSVSRKSGMFEYMAVWSAKKAKAEPWGMYVMFKDPDGNQFVLGSR